ncbi:hypothetical protein C8Q76DRAFT_801914 [Earliella scabrosa]|nr:hypothetical protein C8Q76DRAFT_801914 [Earliella scabrosa]
MEYRPYGDDPNDIIGVFDGPDDIRRRGDIPLTAPPPSAGADIEFLRENTPDLTDASTDGSEDSSMSVDGTAQWFDALPLQVYAYARYPRTVFDGMEDDPRYTYIRARSLNYYLRISRIGEAIYKLLTALPLSIYCACDTFDWM